MPVEVAFAAGKSTPAVSCKCRCKKKKPDTLANPKKPVSTSFAEDVLKSMVATVKHNEFEAVNSYCSKLMDDHFAVMKKDVSDLCLSMTSVQSRMDQLVEDVDVIRKGITEGAVSMHNLTPQINQDGGNHDRNLDSYLNIQGHKNSPPQTDELIAALVADMNLQNQEMTVWRELFQKM